MGKSQEGNWNFYLSNVNNKPASICLDLNAQRFCENHGHLLCVFVPLKNPHPKHQMTTNEEAAVLYKLEDLLFLETDAINARHVGRITGDGRRDFYFYAPAAGKLDLLRTRKAFPNYEFKVRWVNDPEWKHYREVLFPSPTAMQTIMNRNVLEQLKKSGDSLQKPREVRHWSYFPNETIRDGFADQIVAAGFQVVSAGIAPGSKQKEFPFQLIYSKLDNVDAASIDRVTLPLFHLSLKYGGRYDGWETQVQKDA